MADSLVSLRAQGDAAAAGPANVPMVAENNVDSVRGGPTARAPQAAPQPNVPGDALLERARALVNFGDDQARAIRLFAHSKQVLTDQAAADPEYAAEITPKLGELRGAKLAMGVINAVDDIKIKQRQELEKDLPEYQRHFTSAEAAKVGFFNSLSMGQLTRIMGRVGQEINGRPWQEFAEEKGEEFRLLQKAHPDAFQAGEVVSYFMPGSIVGKVFAKAAFLTSPVVKGAEKLARATGLEGVAEGVLKRIIQDPRTLERAAGIVNGTAKGMLKSSLGAAAGGAAVGGIQGTLGSDTQEFSFDRGLEVGAESATGAAKLGALAPLIGGAVRTLPLVFQGTATKLANFQSNQVAKITSDLSGVPVESIRAYNRFPKDIRAAAGMESKYGQELVDHVLSDEARIVEVHHAKELLPQLPDVSPQKTIDFLRSFKKGGGDPKIDPHIDMLGEWANRIEKEQAASKDGNLSAVQMEAWKKKFQDAASDQYGKESGFYESAIKDAGRIARLSILEKAASHGGDTGVVYKGLMEKAAKKAEVLEFVKKELGSSRQAMLKNAERQADKWFGKNTAFKQDRLADMDRLWGTSFVKNFENAQHAENLGIKNAGDSPAWAPVQTTGRSSLGVNLGRAAGAGLGGLAGEMVAGHGGAAAGATAGGIIGGGVGSVVSSPKMGGMVVGTSDNITGFMKRVVADPSGLQLVAGTLPKRGTLPGFRPAGPGEGANAIAVKRLAVPYQIQRLAAFIDTALVKDGPESAASVTRLIADTPFFAGLVHYIDLAHKHYEEHTMQKALDQTKPGGTR